MHARLLRDPHVTAAIDAHAREHHQAPDVVRRRVEGYIREIVPFFNVLSYYTLGYNAARILVNMLYSVRSPGSDRPDAHRVARDDVVVYVSNHRSNADYVVLAYVLARGVSISYAVGEWARVWPLEYIFKSFGAYFVRRRYREPLYHTVLERYVQLITAHGVTQGIFLEGGLSRDGRLRPPKLGLLDYVVRTMAHDDFDRDIWLVPVAINYDRVLEDRTLIAELIDGPRPGRLRQLLTVARFFAANLVRLLTGGLKRYGRVAVAFGAPISIRRWQETNPNLLHPDRERRLGAVHAVAEEAMRRVAAIIPVTPVPLVAAALLSFGETYVRRSALDRRVGEFLDHLRTAREGSGDTDAASMLERAKKTLAMRRLAVGEGDGWIILPSQRPLLEYYANSIAHLLPLRSGDTTMHPAHEPDDELPSLKQWRPLGGSGEEEA